MPQLEYVTKVLHKLTPKSELLPITPCILQKLGVVWESHPIHFDATMLGQTELLVVVLSDVILALTSQWAMNGHNVSKNY